MTNRKIKTHVGLDVGTSKVATVVAAETEAQSLDIIGASFTPCSSLRKGMVSDIEETVSTISASLEEAERMAGIPVQSAFVSIGGAHVESSDSKGVIAVSGSNGDVTEEDVERVIEAARAVSQPTNREIIHVIPRSYTVDEQSGISEPMGMTGIRLEVDTHIITGSTPAIKNLSKCILQAGLDIDEMVFSGLAAAEILLSKKQKEIGVALLDLGAGVTTLTVFEEGNVLHSAVIPVGASHITNDIAIGLKTSILTAERVKLEYGSATPESISEREMIDLSKFDKDESQAANKKYVGQIIEARLSEIFSLVRDELKSISRDGMLPAGVVVSGGGSKIEGLVELAKETLRLPITIGKPIIELEGLIDKINDPLFATALGLVFYSKKYGQKKSLKLNLSKVSGATGKIRDFFKQFLP